MTVTPNPESSPEYELPPMYFLYGKPDLEERARTLVVLPKGIDASDSWYVDFADSHHLRWRELRGVVVTALGGAVLRGDYPLVEGTLSVSQRDELAGQFGLRAVIIGEDPHASQQGAA